MGEGSGRVGSGRINVSPGRVGSGPRKVTRGQLWESPLQERVWIAIFVVFVVDATWWFLKVMMMIIEGGDDDDDDDSMMEVGVATNQEFPNDLIKIIHFSFHIAAIAWRPIWHIICMPFHNIAFFLPVVNGRKFANLNPIICSLQCRLILSSRCL